MPRLQRDRNKKREKEESGKCLRESGEKTAERYSLRISEAADRHSFACAVSPAHLCKYSRGVRRENKRAFKRLRVGLVAIQAE